MNVTYLGVVYTVTVEVQDGTGWTILVLNRPTDHEQSIHLRVKEVA